MGLADEERELEETSWCPAPHSAPRCQSGHRSPFSWDGISLGLRELIIALKIFMLSALTLFWKLKMDSPRSESKAEAEKPPSVII